MIKKICQNCGKEFEVRISRIKEGKGKYCSKKCFAEAVKQGKYPQSGFQKGHPTYSTKSQFKKGTIYPWSFKKGYDSRRRNIEQERIDEILRLYAEKNSIEDIVEKTKLGSSTIHLYLRKNNILKLNGKRRE